MEGRRERNNLEVVAKFSGQGAYFWLMFIIKEALTLFKRNNQDKGLKSPTATYGLYHAMGLRPG